MSDVILTTHIRVRAPDIEKSPMKYVAILMLHPGVEAQQKAIELFAKIGSDPTVVKSLVSLDGLTSYHLAEADEPDLGHNAAFAPYFDVQMVPVVDLDEAWFNQYTKGMAMRDWGQWRPIGWSSVSCA